MLIGSNHPEPRAGQLDRCQVCGDKWHRDQLVRTQVDTIHPESENYFNYSSYDGTYWVVDTASDAGSVSYGNHCDEARTSLSLDNVITIVNGVQTWEGDGVLRSTVISPRIDANDYVVFSAQVGPHEQNSSPNMIVVLGVCNSDGSVLQPVRSWSMNGTKRIWFTELASTLQDHGLGSGLGLYFYISVTNDGKWWIDEMQLEVFQSSDAKPGVFLETIGSLLTHSVDTPVTTTRVVCPECFERVFKRSERYGRQTDIPVAPPVKPYMQEF